jgi:hypothetical protein
MRKDQHTLCRKGGIAAYMVTVDMRIDQETDLTRGYLSNRVDQFV